MTKKTKSLKLFLVDFKEIYDAMVNISLLGYMNSAVYVNTLQDHKIIEKDATYLKVKNFSRQNNLYNFLLVNLISVTESYLQNVLIEIIDNNPQKANEFVLKYKIDRNILPQDLVDGPKKFTLRILNNIIYHNLPKVNFLFKIISNVDILNKSETDIDLLLKIINLRHKFVHKGSKHNDKKIYLGETTMLGYMNLINHWVSSIDNKIMGSNTRKFDCRLKFYKEISTHTSSPVLINGMLYSAAVSTEILSLHNNSKKKILL